MEDYNWSLILATSLPIGAVVAAVFYLNINNGWKYLSLVAGILLAGAVMYTKDKKKSNVYTAVAIVFLIALATNMLRRLGLI